MFLGIIHRSGFLGQRVVERLVELDAALLQRVVVRIRGAGPSLADLSPAFNRPAQGEFVGEFKAAPGGQAVGDARDFGLLVGPSPGQVKARGVALDIGPQGENDFANWFRLQARLEFVDPQVFRTDPVQR